MADCGMLHLLILVAKRQNAIRRFRLTNQLTFQPLPVGGRNPRPVQPLLYISQVAHDTPEVLWRRELALEDLVTDASLYHSASLGFLNLFQVQILKFCDQNPKICIQIFWPSRRFGRDCCYLNCCGWRHNSIFIENKKPDRLVGSRKFIFLPLPFHF